MIDDDAFTKPSYWRERASAVRALADGFQADDNKSALQAVALKYDNMAVWAERRAVPQPSREAC